MKTKLFLAAALFIVGIVGYQKYAELSSLKSIDSYESCVTAKGRVIQESYPATCVTRLGTRFTLPTTIIPIAPIPSDWKEINLPHWSFLIPPDWHISNCQNKFFIIDSQTKADNNSCPIYGDLYIARQSREQVPEPTYKNYLDVPNIKAITTEVVVADKRATKQILYLPGGMVEGPNIYIEFKEYIDTIKYDANEEEVVTEILSTFKFTD